MLCLDDSLLQATVVCGILPPEEYASDPERLARFEQEARAAAALNHPHIAVVHDVGSETGDDGTITHFMVQEFLEGQSIPLDAFDRLLRKPCIAFVY